MKDSKRNRDSKNYLIKTYIYFIFKESQKFYFDYSLKNMLKMVRLLVSISREPFNCMVKV